MPGIDDILIDQDLGKRVSRLKEGRQSPLPEVTKFKNEWDPKCHKIFDPVERPDKKVYYSPENANGEVDESKTLSRFEKVTRVAVAFQKLIVRRAAAFLFGNPVKVVSEDPASKVAISVGKILKANKQKGLNKRVARTLFSSTEVAEYWYPVKVDKPFKTYGFQTDMKLKCAVFSPLKGDILYPYFDEVGTMVAFSREYQKKEEGKDVVYFETWTATKYYRLKREGEGWVTAMKDKEQKAVDGIDLKLGKIPIVYASQEEVEWNDVQWMIDRFEKLVSNFGDTNDYHGSPKIAVKGTVKGFSKKGESGGILEMEGEDADAKYLAWEHAPEAIKLEIENLMRLIYSITQTPDISFDAVKGLGSAASGQSLKMLFLDAHLKVMDKLEIFDDYLERRFNILKTFVGKLNKDLEAEAEEIELTPEVVPFMVDDDKDTIDNLVTARAGKIISRKTAVTLNPLVKDPDAELEQLEIEREQDEASALALNNAQNGNPDDEGADPED